MENKVFHAVKLLIICSLVFLSFFKLFKIASGADGFQSVPLVTSHSKLSSNIIRISQPMPSTALSL